VDLIVDLEEGESTEIVILLREMCVFWCPETELNRRHADFQSAALPTELSGPIARWHCQSGGAVLCEGAVPVQRVRAKTCAKWLLRAGWCRVVGSSVIILLCLGRDRIASRQPSAQIHIRTATRTKRAILRIAVFGANGASHGNTSAKGNRSRLRVISNRPSVVHPARLVSAASPLKTPRRT
jgi:hypothetical protein